MDFIELSKQCSPLADPGRMAAIMRVESSFNPFAIGVVHGRLERQPKNIDEAVATVKALERDGWNFSLGAAQVNRYNLPKYGMDYAGAFDPCSSIRAGAGILADCHDRALLTTSDQNYAWQMAFSCYYSGNFKTGFRSDFPGQPSYVRKVLAGAGEAKAIPVIATHAQRNTLVIGPTGRGKSVVSGHLLTQLQRATKGAQRTAQPIATEVTAADSWAVYGAKEL